MQISLHSAKLAITVISLQIGKSGKYCFFFFYRRLSTPSSQSTQIRKDNAVSMATWWHHNWPGLKSSRRVLWFSLRCSDCRFTSLTVNTLDFSLGIIPVNSKRQGYLHVSIFSPKGNCPLSIYKQKCLPFFRIYSAKYCLKILKITVKKICEE